MEDGLLFGRDFGTCTESVRNQFNLAIKIENGKGQFVNSLFECEYRIRGSNAKINKYVIGFGLNFPFLIRNFRRRSIHKLMSVLSGELYVNGGLESKFTPFFPPINKVATAMRNNMESKMIVNNLQVCQGNTLLNYTTTWESLLQCVSKIIKKVRLYRFIAASKQSTDKITLRAELRVTW